MLLKGDIKMLKSSKSQTLNGSSTIDNQVVATLNGTVNADNTISFNYYISNKELYEANKTEVRKDISDFQEQLYEIADEN